VEVSLKSPTRTERGHGRRGEPAETVRGPVRTCVGCGSRDGAAELVRLIIADDEVAFDLAGGAFGRGAHVHARLDCLEKAPRGLSRAFKRPMKQDAAALGERLVEACNRRIAGLLLAARRSGTLTMGADAVLEVLGAGAGSRGEGSRGRAGEDFANVLVVLSLDAGSLTSRKEVQSCVAAGRAVAWGTKNELGSLLGASSVAICAVRHAGIADELKRMRVSADAGAAATRATREGAECSRCPEAR
jgi:predicted RNA-binding protein YlxR (DUF448 family)